MNVEHVQTKQEIEQLLGVAGIRPRKRFGQHFLIDGNLMRKLVNCAEIGPHDLVLEVGGGTGGLTDLLVSRAGHIVCVEVDRDLHGILLDRFAEAGNITIVLRDALESKHRVCRELAEAIRDFDGGQGGEVKLVANLPYQVATPLVMDLLVDHPAVCRLVFTVQAEVGERLVAHVGDKSYGPLSIVSQLRCGVEIVARIPPQAFWPRPAVDSVMMRMEVRETSPIAPGDVPTFARFVRAVFDHRRKTLRSALRYVVDVPTQERICRSRDASRRPESVALNEWVAMYELTR
ncbi:MAG: ribosomal RNA small subunit methyltransferase A [Planctomycetes bacterium]|nr:ribosomal RNA small subunit methyltransferase A [Planctomycetota bacterium]